MGRDLNSELTGLIEKYGSQRVLSILVKWLAERESILVTQKKMNRQLFEAAQSVGLISEDVRFKP